MVVENAVAVPTANGAGQMTIPRVENASSEKLASKGQVLVQDRNGFVRPLLGQARVVARTQAEFDEGVVKAKKIGLQG